MSSEKKLKDKKIKCVDCGHDFVWTADEQKYYLDRGLAQPKRCVKCRLLRRQAIRNNTRIITDEPKS